MVVAGPAVHVCLGPACPDSPGYELQIVPPSGGCDWTVISDNSDTGAGERPADSAAACCNHKISTSRIDIQISFQIQISRYPQLIYIQIIILYPPKSRPVIETVPRSFSGEMSQLSRYPENISAGVVNHGNHATQSRAQTDTINCHSFSL